MDLDRLTTLVRSVALAGPRRPLLGALVGAPLLGGLLAALDLDEAAAKDRRRRRKQRHRKRKNPGKRKGGCKAKSKAKICTGRCGTIKNRDTCGKTVDCGSCDCSPPCAACFACQSDADTPGTCVVDLEQVGEPCGGVGQVCQGDGSCACEAGTCANPTPICASGACTACAADSECQAANAGDLCCAGSCFAGVCCADDQCLDHAAPDCVAHDCVCAANGDAACPGGEACCGDGCADLQSDPDHCGDCQTSCSGTTPICDSGTCVACDATHPCPNGCCQSDGSCGSTCLVFFSSSLHATNLGGLAGADAICQDLAENAGLPGTYLAWLSDGTDSPSTRFPLAGSTTVGPYVLPGTPLATVAANWELLTNRPNCGLGSSMPCLSHAINRDETGAPYDPSTSYSTATGTTQFGTSFPENATCGKWTSSGSTVHGAVGDLTKADMYWTRDYDAITCTFDVRLYCFQQG